jgi:hypothetical protein
MHTGSTSVLEFASRTRAGGSAPWVRVGLAAVIAFAPVTGALAQGTRAQAPQNNQQRQTEGQRLPTPGRLVVPVTGTVGIPPTAPEGEAAAAPALTGSFAIQRFARTTEDSVAAVGTLTLNLTDPATNAARTIVTQVAMPLAKSGDPGIPDGTAAQPQPAGATACGTLSMVLGPLELTLLGLPFQLNEVTVDFAVVAGTGDRVGNLLCEVTSLVDGAARPAELVKTLNTLLDTIG